MTLIDSEDAPTGEDNIGKDIKVLVRGEPNVFDLSYGYTSMEKNKSISYSKDTPKSALLPGIKKRREENEK